MTDEKTDPTPHRGVMGWTDEARRAGLKALAAEFPPDQVSLLPKQVMRDDQDRGKCEPGSRYSADGLTCGGRHARSVHLHYVGHADVTTRLLEVDPEWTWEPMAVGPDGLPLRSEGGMWIRLTVLGVTRLGFGDAQGKQGPNAVKEIIGDAIRNAAMRFGVGTYLWSKSDAARAKVAQEGGDADEPAVAQVQPTTEAVREQARTIAQDALAAVFSEAEATDEERARVKAEWVRLRFPNDPADWTREHVAQAGTWLSTWRAQDAGPGF